MFTLCTFHVSIVPLHSTEHVCMVPMHYTYHVSSCFYRTHTLYVPCFYSTHTLYVPCFYRTHTPFVPCFYRTHTPYVPCFYRAMQRTYQTLIVSTRHQLHLLWRKITRIISHYSSYKPNIYGNPISFENHFSRIFHSSTNDYWIPNPF